LNEFWKVVRESLPEIIGGLAVALTLALIGTVFTKFGWVAAVFVAASVVVILALFLWLYTRKRISVEVTASTLEHKDELSRSPFPTFPSVQMEPFATPEKSQPPLSTTTPSPLLESPAFKQLLYFVRRKQCRLFIGSGVSSEAGMPSVQELQEALRAELVEMGQAIRTDATLPELATALERIAGRPYLINVLRRLFDNALRGRPWEQGAYRWIPYLPPDLVQVIYTTNWDDCLKRAFEAAGQTAHEIRYPNELSLIPQAEHVIVKMHRDFQASEGPVISEADYAIVLNDIQRGTAGTLWGHLADQLAQFRFVFVGYSLGDPTLKLILRAVELSVGTVGEKRHFLVAPLSLEEARAAERWAGVYPIIAGASEFFQKLAQELQEARRNGGRTN